MTMLKADVIVGNASRNPLKTPVLRAVRQNFSHTSRTLFIIAAVKRLRRETQSEALGLCFCQRKLDTP